MTPRHATRATYIAGCRCFACRVANAHYIARYRLRQRAGAVLLGAKIDSARARRLLDQLRREQVTNTAIAHALGLRSPELEIYDRITVRRFLQIKRVHRRYMSEAHD